ncbi:MAG: 4Fe-4S binding protein [Bacteriovoracaceae bacterium]|nr:4Fe-4S binding protein [Bacteriovoracaceae bacterium]
MSPFSSASTQNSLPGRYSIIVQVVSFVAFIYVILGYLNERVFHWVVNESGNAPFWLSHVTEYIVIAIFGLWRAASEKNRYTRFRLITLILVVMLVYWFIPHFLAWSEPYVGKLPFDPIFPKLHVPGTLSFFITLLLVFLFGRRIKCGWGCPCVGIRETVGFAFRGKTVKSDLAFRLRHIKWIFFSFYIVCIVLILFYSQYSVYLYPFFLGLLIVPYFITMLLAPVIGNRGQCRYICPYGATFGLINRIGFFKIEMDGQKCNECRLCEKVCDMGIAVCSEGNKKGHVISIEECMGCARCVTACPNNALAIKDVRNTLSKNLHQDKKHLLKEKQI